MYLNIFEHFTNIQLVEIIESPDRFNSILNEHYPDAPAECCHRDLLQEICIRFCHATKLEIKEHSSHVGEEVIDWPW